jgi:hypothetical protein
MKTVQILQIALVGLLLVGYVAPERQTRSTSRAPVAVQPSLQPEGNDGEDVQRRTAGRATARDILALLEGARIVADDGQFLGVITQNQFASDSILNEFGRYGSKFSATSIFNEFGRYGGKFSPLSPFNEFTMTPPRIITPGGKFVAYLTKNQFKTPALDPHVLIALLKGGR